MTTTRSILLSSLVLASCATTGADVDDPADIETVTNRVDTADGEQTLTYQVIDGRAIFQGDIDLGDSADIASHAMLRSSIRTGGDFRWPGGRVPYVIEDAPHPDDVRAAIAQWEKQTLFKFVPKTAADTDYVAFTSGSGNFCRSNVGRAGGRQTITLPAACRVAETVHEIGHAVGMWHEVSRGDRDSYVTINTVNITDDCIGQYGLAGASGRDVFNFDYSSVMLYTAYACAKNPSIPTMWKKNTNQVTWAPQNGVLSLTDVKSAALLVMPVTATTIHLQSNASAKCLTANADAGDNVNGSIYAYDCNDAFATQKWFRYAVPGKAFDFKLINSVSGLCLSHQYANGYAITQQPCAGSSVLQSFTTKSQDTYWQAWRNDTSGYCLDQPGKTNGSPVGVATCADHAVSQEMFSY